MFILLMHGSFFAHGQTSGNETYLLSLHELLNAEVYSVGLFPATAATAPGYITVFDMQNIDDTPVRNLYDLLTKHAPGSAVGNHERQGALHGVRGILIDNNAKTLVMIDGQQVNARSHFGYMTHMHSPLLGGMQTIEVINGPGAIQHGSGAINGFINMLPKTGESNPGLSMNASYGEAEDFYMLDVGYGGSYGERKNLYLYAGFYDADGYEPENALGNELPYTDQAVDALAFNEQNHMTSIVWQHRGLKLNIFAYETNPQKNNNDERGYFHNETLGLKPAYHIAIDGHHSVDIEASMLWFDHRVEEPDSSRGGNERHMEIKATYKNQAFDHQAVAIGALYGEKHFDTSQYFSSKPDSASEAVKTDWQEISLFAEDIMTLTPSLTASMGFRFDLYRLSPVQSDLINPAFTPQDPDAHFSPRLAIAWQITEASTIKASYQHGFRMPDAAYYDWNLYNNRAAKALGFTASGTLKPEEMDSFEINFSHLFGSLLSLEINLFYNQFKDQLSWGALENYWSDSEVAAINNYNAVNWGGGMFQNSQQEFNAYGGELIIRYQLLDNTLLNASYGYAKMDDDNAIQRYPMHQIKINSLSGFLNDRLKFSIDYLFSSKYPEMINFMNSTSIIAMKSTLLSSIN